jgi:hypothetical protein
MRDILLKNIILSQFPEGETYELMRKIDVAFKEADLQWGNEYLPALFGKADASRIKRILQESEIS